MTILNGSLISDLTLREEEILKSIIRFCHDGNSIDGSANIASRGGIYIFQRINE